MTEINKKIDEVIVKVWNMSSSSQESVVRQATLDWAREELRKLFPQPLDEGLKVLVDGEWVEASKELKDTARSIEQALQRKPLDDKDRLLTKEERVACIPTPSELESYLATPDDEVARKLRESLIPESFEKLGLIILYTENIEKAQDAKTFALLQPKIEEAKVGEARDIIKCVTDAKRVHPNWKAGDIIDLLTFREETREALKRRR